MKKIEWVAVGVVLGLGILSQIPRHDHARMPEHDHEFGTAAQAVTDNATTVTLAVSGMT